MARREVRTEADLRALIASMERRAARLKFMEPGSEKYKHTLRTKRLAVRALSKLLAKNLA